MAKQGCHHHTNTHSSDVVSFLRIFPRIFHLRRLSLSLALLPRGDEYCILIGSALSQFSLRARFERISSRRELDFPGKFTGKKITPFRYIKPLLKRVCEWDSKQRRRGRHSIWLLFIMIIITQTFNWVSWSRVRVFHTTTRERGKLSTPGTLETEAASGIWCHYRLASLGRWFSPLRGRRLWFGLKSFLATNTHWITNGGEEREKLFSEQIVQLEDNKCSEGLPAV